MNIFSFVDFNKIKLNIQKRLVKKNENNRKRNLYYVKYKCNILEILLDNIPTAETLNESFVYCTTRKWHRIARQTLQISTRRSQIVGLYGQSTIKERTSRFHIMEIDSLTCESVNILQSREIHKTATASQLTSSV